MTKILSSKPQRILVIVVPYLGDVLLATPLIHSLKCAYPEAKLDVLVFKASAAMLEGNADIDQVISVPNRPSTAENWALIKRIFRRYDLAMALQTGDRAFWYTLIASSIRVNAVPPKGAKTAWKRFFTKASVAFDDEHTHTVLQNLKLLECLAIAPCFELVPPINDNHDAIQQRFAFLKEQDQYAVLHLHPQWTYKRWTEQGWFEIGHYLRQLGLKLVLTGSLASDEQAYIAGIASKLPTDTLNITGQVSLAELSYIIGRAKLFIGPDTGITHLAAATGIPVVALFGPTNPVKWAPWPTGYASFQNPFQKVGDQHVGNVLLVQGKGDCVPCYLEGCDRHRQSHSRCLDELSTQQIKDAIRRVLLGIA